MEHPEPTIKPVRSVVRERIGRLDGMIETTERDVVHFEDMYMRSAASMAGYVQERAELLAWLDANHYDDTLDA